MNKSSGKIWPYSIGAAIILVFGFCVATVVVTKNVNIQESDAYMTHYQEADRNANELIQAKIAFDQKYKIEYVSDGISEKGAVLKYKVMDINAKPINNAELALAKSRPETKEFNQQLESPVVENGVYSFSGLEFPKPGVWNIIVKVSIDEYYRFYNVKVDTRNKNAFEF